jgi:hypothetical protein
MKSFGLQDRSLAWTSRDVAEEWNERLEQLLPLRHSLSESVPA